MWASPGRLSMNSPLPGGITRASNTTAPTTLGSASSCRHHRLHRSISLRFLRLFGKNGGRLIGNVVSRGRNQGCVVASKCHEEGPFRVKALCFYSLPLCSLSNVLLEIGVGS